MGSDEIIITYENGKPLCGSSGKKLVIIFPLPRCIVDSHMHIMSGACTPLPLLWAKNMLIDNLSRDHIDGLAKFASQPGIRFLSKLGESGIVQVMDTVAIAARAVKDNTETYSGESLIKNSGLYRKCEFHSIMIAMPMDMEYAHIAGYDGQPVYHTDRETWYFHKRISGKEPEENGMAVDLPGENMKTFSNWKKQHKHTVLSAINNPLKVIPMYHYEPRRWRAEKGLLPDNKLQNGGWDYPFNDIVTKTKKGIFIGYKMYTPLGYQPLDPALKHLWKYNGSRSECFYGKCADEGIPILNHCSPGGMTTHELFYYRELHMSKKEIFGEAMNECMKDLKPEKRDTSHLDYDPEYEENYFYRCHVHPKAWRKVLERFPDLKLCLAHFGSAEWSKGLESDWIQEIISLIETYPNVYADFSCHDIIANGPVFRELLTGKDHPKVFDRLLFGTDWYMTMLAIKGKGYRQFCEEYWTLIDECEDHWKEKCITKNLWLRFTFVNPFEFYGLNDCRILKNLDSAIGDEIDSDSSINCKSKKHDARKNNYNKMLLMQKEYEKLKKKTGENNVP